MKLTIIWKQLMYRHSKNKNLTIIENDTFNGLPLTHPRGEGYYSFISQYLESNRRVLDDALSIHPRTLAIRVDLRFPTNYHDDDYPKYNNKPEITRFIESFKAKVNSKIIKRRREGKRAHSSNVNFIWVLEYGKNGSEHYHVALFLNGDSFLHPGGKSTPDKSSPLINTIVEAWESALNVSFTKAWDLVNIPPNASYRLKSTEWPEKGTTYCNLYERLSYLAKVNTKFYGVKRRKNYGSSRTKSRQNNVKAVF